MTLMYHLRQEKLRKRLQISLKFKMIKGYCLRIVNKINGHRLMNFQENSNQKKL